MADGQLPLAALRDALMQMPQPISASMGQPNPQAAAALGSAMPSALGQVPPAMPPMSTTPASTGQTEYGGPSADQLAQAGTSSPGLPINLGSTDQPGQVPTRQNPNPIEAIRALFGGGNTTLPKGPLDPTHAPVRPVSRLDAFEGFLGNFLNSFAMGMSQAGQGPGAPGRGFAGAVLGPYQQQLAQYQLGQQSRMQEAQIQLQQAEAQQRTQQVMTPWGMMPVQLAQRVWPAGIQGQARVAAAGTQKQYMTTPFGVFDTKAGNYIGGTSGGGIGATVKMTQEMADSGQYGPGASQLVGKDVKLSDLSSMERATAGEYGFVQGSQGAAREQKVGPTGNLGLGSPAANPVAMANLQLRRQAFERDTFGQLFVNPQNYPGLTGFIDDQGGMIGWKSPAAPTAQTKGKAQNARGVLQVMQEAQSELKAADDAGLLGPEHGRFNEWYVGSLGGNDPQFAALRTIMSLANSGALNVHFGARGASNVLEKYNNLNNQGRMTYGDLTASLGEMMKVMRTYTQEARTGQAPSKPGGAVTATPITGGSWASQYGGVVRTPTTGQ